MTNQPQPDPREQLKAQIEALANTASEVWPDVGFMLSALLGAMQINHVPHLLHHTTEYVEEELELMGIKIKKGGRTS